MPVLLILHSVWRWAVLIVALLALYGLIRSRREDPMPAVVGYAVRWYPVVLDIQVALGILLWLAQRWGAVPLTPIQVIHPVWGLLAAGAAHGAAAFRERENPARARGMLAAYGLSLLLVFIALDSVGAFPFGRR
ncbi:hypothetical protein [Thermoflexus sp.]|jgi:hypothetical protein|uniref:hypothetical protein n=1 Tax=Thermoflexus sp. TaxID=1969742 RepID=UPI002612AF15|nr:hypothetical protein [Thermoflexus sp.]